MRFDIVKLLEDAKDLGARNILRTAMLVCLAGFVLLCLAMALNLLIVPFSGRLNPDAGLFGGLKIDGLPAPRGVRVEGLSVPSKEVGFFWALSWSLFCCILTPVIVGCCLWMRAGMNAALLNLANAGMARDAAFKPLAAADLANRWRIDRRASAPISAGVFLLVIMVLFWDFYSSAAGPIMQGLPSLIDPETGKSTGRLLITHAVNEYDWSVACLLQGARVPGGCATNVAFDALAYLFLNLCIGFIFASVVDAVLFVAFASGMTPSPLAMDAQGRELPRDWRLTASPIDAEDRLCGFKVFEPFLTAMLCAALVILLSLILMLLQNAYLRDGASNSILAFLLDDWQAASAVATDMEQWKNPLQVLAKLLSSGEAISSNSQSAMGLIVFAFVVVFGLGAVYVLLRRAAESGRDLARGNIEILAAEQGIAEAEVAARLKSMLTWPLGWLTLNQAIVAVAVMSMGLFSYRVILLAVVLGLGIALARMLKGAGAALAR